MSPDVGRFAPFAPAVFGRGRLPVPVTVSDLTLGAENPVAAALRAVVATLAGRCTAVDVLDARHARTGAPHVLAHSRRPRAVRAVGRRARHQLGPRRPPARRVARRRRRRGHVGGGHRPTAARRRGPGAAGRARRGLSGRGAALRRHRRRRHAQRRSARRVGGPPASRPPPARRSPPHRRVDASASPPCSAPPARSPPDEAWQLASVAGAIDGLGEQAMVGGAVTDVALDVREVAAVLDDALGTARGRLRTRSGDVLLTGLVPLRNVPARVVCLLGVDADSLRPATVDGDDLLARRPCVGERDRRAERRHGLLDAVHGGVRPRDHHVRRRRRRHQPAGSPERRARRAARRRARHGRRRRHRRAPPSPRLRRAAVRADAIAPSYDEAMLAAAATRRAAVVTPTWASRFDAPLPLLVPAEVDLEQLATACTRPARVLLRDRLDVRVPDDFDRGDVNIALGLVAAARRRARPRPARSTARRRWRRSGHRRGPLAVRRRGERPAGAAPPRRGVVGSVREAQVLAMLTGDAPGAPGRRRGAGGRAPRPDRPRDRGRRTRRAGRRHRAHGRASCRPCSTRHGWPSVSVTRSPGSSAPPCTASRSVAHTTATSCAPPSTWPPSSSPSPTCRGTPCSSRGRPTGPRSLPRRFAAGRRRTGPHAARGRPRAASRRPPSAPPPVRAGIARCRPLLAPDRRDAARRRGRSRAGPRRPRRRVRRVRLAAALARRARRVASRARRAGGRSVARHRRVPREPWPSLRKARHDRGRRRAGVRSHRTVADRPDRDRGERRHRQDLLDQRVGGALPRRGGVSSIDQLLVVTFTRAAASELRDRIRSSLRRAADHLAGAPLPPDDAWMSALTRPDGRGDDRRAERLARLASAPP